MIDINETGTLFASQSEEKLSELLEVNIKTVKRWKTGKFPVPKPIRLIMQFINWGELAAIGGKEWEGFTINLRDHKLNIPGFSQNREGFSPGQLKDIFFKIQYIPQLESKLKYKSELLESAKNELIAEKKKTEYYRHQLRQAGAEYSEILTMKKSV
jgi:hypothetical protein